MSAKELLEAVAAVPMPDFHVRRNGRESFHVQALTIEGRNWMLDNVEGISGPELIGGLTVDIPSIFGTLDEILDAGLTVV